MPRDRKPTGSERTPRKTNESSHSGASDCCYHGWLFDVEGRCLDMPCEPADSTYKEKVRQPWYPCREYHGLVFG